MNAETFLTFLTKFRSEYKYDITQEDQKPNNSLNKTKKSKKMNSWSRYFNFYTVNKDMQYQAIYETIMLLHDLTYSYMNSHDLLGFALSCLILHELT